MTPPYTHVNFDPALTAGAFRTSVIGSPGTQAAGTTGMQGIIWSAPRAAAVALATDGFTMLLHIPNGGMFCMGR